MSDINFTPFIIVWIASAAVVALLAKYKNKELLPWVLFSLLASGLVAFIVLLMSPATPQSTEENNMTEPNSPIQANQLNKYIPIIAIIVVVVGVVIYLINAIDSETDCDKKIVRDAVEKIIDEKILHISERGLYKDVVPVLSNSTLKYKNGNTKRCAAMLNIGISSMYTDGINRMVSDFKNPNINVYAMGLPAHVLLAGEVLKNNWNPSKGQISIPIEYEVIGEMINIPGEYTIGIGLIENVATFVKEVKQARQREIFNK